MDEIHSFIVIKVFKLLLCQAAGMSHQNQKGFKRKYLLRLSNSSSVKIKNKIN